jgi:hypothetical protein
MNSLSSLGKNTFGIKNFFRSLEDSVHQEQRELIFHKKSWEDEAEYFNFIKFLFNDPAKI